MQDVLLGLVEMVQLPIDLRQSEVVVRVVRFDFDEFLELLECRGVFLLSKQRLRQPAPVADISGVELNRFAVRLFGLRRVVGLRVGVAQQVEQPRGGRAFHDPLEQSDGLR